MGWRNPQQIAAVLVTVSRQFVGKTEWFNALVPDRFFSRSKRLNLASFGHKDSVDVATKKPWWASGEKWYLSEDEEQIRMKYADYFRHFSDVELLAERYFDEHTSVKTLPMTLSDFARHIQVQPNNANLSTLRRLLEKH